MIPEKPYKLSFDERPRYLHARVTSDKMSAGMALAYLKDIVDECRELGYTRVMIERDRPEALPVLKMIRVSSDFAKLEIHGLKIAGVDNRIERRNLNKFGELVG